MLIPALSDFKSYTAMLEAINPAEAKNIHGAYVMVEADVKEAIQEDVAAGNPDADTLTNYVDNLSEAFFKAFNRLDNKFGKQKFSLAKEDIGNTIGLLNDLVGKGDVDPRDLHRHIAKLEEIRGGIYDPDNARYGAGSDVIAPVHGILEGFNDALAHLKTYADTMMPAPAAPAPKPAPKKEASSGRPVKKAIQEPVQDNTSGVTGDTVKDTYDYYYNTLNANNYPGIIIAYTGDQHHAMIVTSRIQGAIKDATGEEFDENVSFTFEGDIKPNGCVYEIQPIDTDDKEILPKIAEAVKAALGPYAQSTKVYVRNFEVDNSNTLGKYKGGEYAVNYQWILRAIGKPESGSFNTLAVLAGYPPRQGDALMTSLAKIAADKINDIPLGELDKVSEGDITKWFVRPNKFTEFIAKRLAPQLRDYANNVRVSTMDTTDKEGNKTGRDVGKIKSNDLWKANRGIGTGLSGSGSFMGGF